MISLRLDGRFRVVMLAVSLALAGVSAPGMPPPFDQPKRVELALVRYFSTGDFFMAYRAGAEDQAAALGVRLQVYDSDQDAERQAALVDHAIAQGVDGIILCHGLPATMRAAARRAVAAGVAVVAFDVDVGHAAVPQIEQDDRNLARLVLDQAIADNGESWQAAYVHVPGIAPLDRRNEAWTALLARYPKVQERAVFGTLQEPIAESTAVLAAGALASNPGITVVFAPYDEFARGVKQAAEAVGAAARIRIYSADISNADIAAMREPGSPWVATAATDPAAIGRVSVRALAMLLAGESPGARVVVPATLITRELLNEQDVRTVADLASRLPGFAGAAIAHPDWMREYKPQDRRSRPAP